MTGMNESVIEYVTALIGGQLFGLPIPRVQDVFKPEGLTRVPLAAPEIAGLLNRRGRIVTVVDMRRRLDFAAGARGRAPRAGGAAPTGDGYGSPRRPLRQGGKA